MNSIRSWVNGRLPEAGGILSTPGAFRHLDGVGPTFHVLGAIGPDGNLTVKHSVVPGVRANWPRGPGPRWSLGLLTNMVTVPEVVSLLT